MYDAPYSGESIETRYLFGFKLDPFTVRIKCKLGTANGSQITLFLTSVMHMIVC